MKDRMLDMHAHLACFSDEYAGSLSEEGKLELAYQELILREKYGLTTVFSCGTPEEWNFMQRYRGECLLSFGIHPWYSDRYQPQDYQECFRECAVVGEIGMDSVWCDVPLLMQREVFEQQLEIAAQLGKSVILHTKGQEAQIAELIRDFPGQICVHWYSGDEDTFERFLETGCYFTLGPDLAEKEKAALYSRMIREIPPDRLFLETDGVSSIAWARGKEYVPLKDAPVVLGQNLTYVAQQKQISPKQLQNVMWENLRRFCGIQP